MIFQKLIIVFLFLGLSSEALSYKIEWGELERSPGSLSTIFPVSAKDFFAIRYTGRGIFGARIATYHSSFKISATGKIKPVIDRNVGNYEGCITLNGKFYMFVSDRVNDRQILYMQEYSNDIVQVGEAVNVGEFAIPQKRGYKSFSVIHSRDHQFFTVYWEIVERKSRHTSYGYNVFDSEQHLISSGEYELPYEDGLADITTIYLSNTGDFFLGVEEFEVPEGKKLRKRTFKTLHIYQITPSGLDEFELQMEGKNARTVILTSDNQNKMVVTGLYTNDGESGISGIFSLVANFDSKTIESENYEEFTKDFITQDWSEKEKKKSEKREAKGKGEPALFNYVMRNTELTQDGSTVGSIEQYYVVVVTRTDPRTGTTTTTTYYYYNDIIAFKIGKNGGFDWVKKIAKKQMSTNDYGLFSSYARFIDDGRLCFIYNDNIDNYDEQGRFLDESKTQYARFTKKKNQVVLTSVDLESGDVNRAFFFNRKEVGTLAVPKLFEINYKENTMLLYTLLRKKERFGLLTMQE